MTFTGRGSVTLSAGRRQSSIHLIAALLAMIAWLWPHGAAMAQGELDAFEDVNTEATVNAYLSHVALPASGEGTLLVLLDIPENFHIQINEFLEITAPEDAPIILGKPVIKPNRLAWRGRPQGPGGHHRALCRHPRRRSGRGLDHLRRRLSGLHGSAHLRLLPAQLDREHAESRHPGVGCHGDSHP